MKKDNIQSKIDGIITTGCVIHINTIFKASFAGTHEGIFIFGGREWQ